MGKVEIDIEQIGTICLRLKGNSLHIDDLSNDGIITCGIKDLKKTIRIIEDAYKNRNNLESNVYGYGRNTIQLTYYQYSICKNVFYGNYIEIKHMPAIIKMLESVKVEKEKYILNKESLFGLSIDELDDLKQTMRKRKKVLTDRNGCKYIEV